MAVLLLISACNSGNEIEDTEASFGDVELLPLKVGIQKIAALTNAWVAEQEGGGRKRPDVGPVEFKPG